MDLHSDYNMVAENVRFVNVIRIFHSTLPLWEYAVDSAIVQLDCFGDYSHFQKQIQLISSY